MPPINPTPGSTAPISASYWWTWALCFALLLTPALVMAVFRRSRRAAAGYAVTATVLGGLLAAAFISVDLGGFAPS
ncbi:hypothetical protein [Tomitella fengzijianii]|uniref:Uncharacterized protein n=1 Tax=Tomitella fengzijianii TaxID=2597660 RepID=A0A516X6K1_9ACTN|nr:hypothetical protein [Tomitella fengzijianii]QDQ98707.1 hypothetical protein FO059_16940 [Tomitella fengzijianii]